jgi:hypothetical protein
MVRSELHVRDALDDIAMLNEKMRAAMKPYQEDLTALEEAIERYMLKRGPGIKIEHETATVTVVQSHTRKWNADKLRALIPMGVYKNVVELVVNRDKLNEYVAAGKIDRSVIEDAYEEVPNKPYVKRTPKSDKHDAQAEADSLAKAAG